MNHTPPDPLAPDLIEYYKYVDTRRAAGMEYMTFGEWLRADTKFKDNSNGKVN